MLQNGNQVVIDRVVLGAVVNINIVLKLLHRQNISIFVLAKSFRKLLNRNICEVHKLIVRIIWVEDKFVRAGPEVALFAEKCLAIWIQKYPYSDIELSLGNEQGSLYVLLQNEAIMLKLRPSCCLSSWIADFSWCLLFLGLLLEHCQAKSVLFGGLGSTSLASW